MKPDRVAPLAVSVVLVLCAGVAAAVTRPTDTESVAAAQQGQHDGAVGSPGGTALPTGDAAGTPAAACSVGPAAPAPVDPTAAPAAEVPTSPGTSGSPGVPGTPGGPTSPGAPTSSGAPAAPAPVRIGHVGSYPGPEPGPFRPGRDALEAWAARVNAGGLAGHPVVLVGRDDRGDAAAHLQAVRELLADGVAPSADPATDHADAVAAAAAALLERSAVSGTWGAVVTPAQVEAGLRGADPGPGCAYPARSADGAWAAVGAQPSCPASN